MAFHSWCKPVIAREFDGLRLFISNYFTPESRVMLRRNIVERAQTLAPFLHFDLNPYIVADADVIPVSPSKNLHDVGEFSLQRSLSRIAPRFPRLQLPAQFR